MSRYSPTHLTDGALLQSVRDELAHRGHATAKILAQLAEIDSRKLYLPLACDSMHAFCVRELKLRPQQAFKWMQVARAARRLPLLLDAIADGRLTRSSVVVLAAHLTEENVEQVLSEAAWKSESELERLVAARSARAEIIATRVDGTAGGTELQLSSRIVESASDPAPPAAPSEASSLADLAPQTHSLHLRLTDQELELLSAPRDYSRTPSPRGIRRRC